MATFRNIARWMMVMANIPVRHFDLVVPLAHEATDMRTTDTAGLVTQGRSGAVTSLIGTCHIDLGLRRGNVDSTTRRSTQPTQIMPGIRTSTTVTRTTTTRALSCVPAPSAGQTDRHHADFSSRLKHVISVSGGKDSTSILLLALENCPRDSIVPIFCDTGNEHQAVYEYLDYLEQTLDITITRLKADFTENIARKRMFIARDQRKGRKNGKPLRWSNKAKRRALAALHPTGNPFLDLCMWKGRFPSRKAQFCTEELKRNMAVGFQLDLIDAGHCVLSWQGVRRDESQNRRNAKKIERIGGGIWTFRPIVEWTAMQVFDFCASRGIQPNPLYKQGMGRVGCMPCINVNKAELKQIALRFPDAIEEKAVWERKVALCSKRMAGTFIPAPGMSNREAAKQTIWAVVEWAKTTRGGKQFDLLGDLADSTACSSAYGLCE